MATVKAGDIAKNVYLMFKDAPHRVVKTTFMNPGKGSAFIRTRLENVQTGVGQEFTFKTNESVELIDVEKKEMQYLYQDGDDVYFMDPRSFDQVAVPIKAMEGQTGFLTADLLCQLLFFEEKVLGVKLPPHVNLKVTESEDAVAGDRVNAPKKPITLETGLVVQAPLFIKVGDVVMVDTDSGEYLSRVN